MLLCTAISFCFLSCSKDDDELSLTDAQKKAIAVLDGKFVWTFYTSKTSYTFGKRYNPPKLVTVNEDYATGKKDQLLLHGEASEIYASGETSSVRYYYVYPNADKIVFITDSYLVYIYDFKVISQTEFRLKYEDDVLWDTYTKE